MSATNPRLPIHAATGTELSARSWQTEAPLRMLMNNLDPANAERPEDLVELLPGADRFLAREEAAGEPERRRGLVLVHDVSAELHELFADPITLRHVLTSMCDWVMPSCRGQQSELMATFNSFKHAIKQKASFTPQSIRRLCTAGT